MCTMLLSPQIIGTNPVMRVNEQSLCDPHTKTLTISAKNVSSLLSTQVWVLHNYCSWLHPDHCQKFVHCT